MRKGQAAIGDTVNGEPLEDQILAQERREVRIVFHDQDALLHSANAFYYPVRVRRVAALTADASTAALVAGVFLAVALLSWFGYRIIEEWRHAAFQLAERRSDDGAHLLLEAFNRDMRGVQESVLTSARWTQFATERPHEINDVVASAFARYPYPETFLTWRRGSEVDAMVFFNRADRPPSWATGSATTPLFPVSIGREPAVARTLFDTIAGHAARGRGLSVFDATLDGMPYQIVAQLTYDDVYRERLAAIVGFTVNRSWVRQHYFSDLTKQVWNIGPGPETGLALSVTDHQGTVVAGIATDDATALTHRRTFNLAFFDPDTEVYPSRDFVPEVWTLAVTASQDQSLLRSFGIANRILALGALSALALAVGLSMMVRTGRAGANLAQMRSDFVSTVTHELKTPIATIKAAAETLSRERLTSMSIQTCGRIVMMETRRLSRLVENLLAYSRLTDIADTYTFEPVEVAAIFNDVQQDCEAHLDQSGFEMEMTIAPGVTTVRGDRLALRLLFDNLVDNAVKYSDTSRTLLLHAHGAERQVTIDVVDSGMGIPEDEIPLITRRFVRGRRASSSGSGLGLAIASRIAEDHGGTLRISSLVGKGTTVTVSLPRA